MPTWVTRACSGSEPELAPDGPAVHVGMKAGEIGAGVDHLDLVGGDAGGHESPLDRLADGDHGGDARGGVAEAVPAAQREAHAAAQDEHGDPDEEPGDERERARPALVAVDDGDALAPDQPRELPGAWRDPPRSRIASGAYGMPAAAHCSAQIALGWVATTTWWPRAWSPQASSRSWMPAPVK